MESACEGSARNEGGSPSEEKLISPPFFRLPCVALRKERRPLAV